MSNLLYILFLINLNVLFCEQTPVSYNNYLDHTGIGFNYYINSKSNLIKDKLQKDFTNLNLNNYELSIYTFYYNFRFLEFTNETFNYLSISYEFNSLNTAITNDKINLYKSIINDYININVGKLYFLRNNRIYQSKIIRDLDDFIFTNLTIGLGYQPKYKFENVNDFEKEYLDEINYNYKNITENINLKTALEINYGFRIRTGTIGYKSYYSSNIVFYPSVGIKLEYNPNSYIYNKLNYKIFLGLKMNLIFNRF